MATVANPRDVVSTVRVEVTARADVPALAAAAAGNATRYAQPFIADLCERDEKARRLGRRDSNRCWCCDAQVPILPRRTQAWMVIVGG